MESVTESDRSRRRLVPILLRAGAALPAASLSSLILIRDCATPFAHKTNAYIQKVIAAGGFGRYQRNQLNALAATFAPHFAHHLPPEMAQAPMAITHFGSGIWL